MSEINRWIQAQKIRVHALLALQLSEFWLKVSLSFYVYGLILQRDCTDVHGVEFVNFLSE